MEVPPEQLPSVVLTISFFYKCFWEGIEVESFIHLNIM